MKRGTSILFIISFCSILHAQQGGFQISKPNYTSQIIPPSPKVEQMMTFGKIPVSYNTGVPEITIPIYTIKQNDVEIPIALRYHLRNLKKSDRMSDIGFGWVLDVGGQISRTVFGAADDASEIAQENFTADELRFDDVYYSSPEVTEYDRKRYQFMYRSAVSKDINTEYDIFRYNFNGKYGEFLVNKLSETNFTAKPISFVPYKFDFSTVKVPPENLISPQPYSFLYEIGITNEKGIRYRFGGANSTESVLSGESRFYYTSWLLNEVTDLRNRKITFSYYPAYNFIIYPEESRHMAVRNEILAYGGWETAEDRNESSYPFSASINSLNTPGNYSVSTSYSVRTIRRIDFEDGHVDFIVNKTTHDISGIDIYNKNGLIKSIKLVKEEFYPAQDILTKVIVQQGSSTQTYGLKYNNYKVDPLSYQDQWGYYAGGPQYDARKRTYSYTNTGDYGIDIFETKEFGRYDARPELSAASSGVLTDILYPTGGKSHFEYELNTYKSDGYTSPYETKTGGGLRIKSILDVPDIGSPDSGILREYKYDDGFINYSYNDPSVYTSRTYDIIGQRADPYGLAAKIYRTTFYEDSSNGYLGNNDVRYEKVVEVVRDIINNKSYKTEMFYEYKNKNKYGWLNDQHDRQQILEKNEWDNGKLYKSIKYDALNRPVKEDKYDYRIEVGDYFDSFSLTNTLNMSERHFSIDCGYVYVNGQYFYVCTNRFIVTPAPLNYSGFSSGNDYERSILPLWKTQMQNQYGYLLWTPFLYKISTGKSYLKGVISKEYFYGNNGTSSQLETITDYEYDSNNIVKKITTSYSDSTKYLKDIYYSSSPLLYSKNMIGIPVRTTTSKIANGTTGVMSDIETIFPANQTEADSKTGGLPLPISVISRDLQNNPTTYTETKFTKYDPSNGNLLEYFDKGITPVSIIWGYGGTQPIAKVEGADYSALNSSLVAAAVAASDQDAADPAREGDLIRALDALRTDAGMSAYQITTYTYDPLIGVTSITPPSGIREVYRYDDAGRLKSVTDVNGKVIKEHKYNYKQQ